MKRILLAILLLAALVAGASVMQSHVAQAHRATGPAPLTNCGSDGYWKDEYDTGRFTATASVDEDVSLEAWTDLQLGNYCGFIRSKDTFFYSCHIQAIDMQTWLTSNVGTINASKNEATWNGCGAPYYALFGFQIQSSSYPCPFQSVGAVVYGAQGYGGATQPHCTL